MNKPQTVRAYDRKTSSRFATVNEEPSLTQQSDKTEADINIIMARYSQTGMLPNVKSLPDYGDFSDVTDYREALDKLKAADEMWANVPAAIRKRFGNDPQEFFSYVHDPENLEQLQEWGLAEKRPETYTPPTPIQAQEEYDDNGQRTRTNYTGPTIYPDGGPSGDAGGRQDAVRRTEAVPPGRPGTPSGGRPLR